MSDLLPVYRVCFDRIGRYPNVVPLTVNAADADDLAGRILDYARPRLFSEQVDVRVDLDRMRGWITVGSVRPAGSFVLEKLDAPVPAEVQGERCGDSSVSDGCARPKGHTDGHSMYPILDDPGATPISELLDQQREGVRG